LAPDCHHVAALGLASHKESVARVDVGPRRVHGSAFPTKGIAVAIVRIIRPQGTTREMYDAVGEKLKIDDDPPAGLIVHTAGEVDGSWQIVDVWESEEHAHRFETERLMPAITEIAGEGNPGAPERTVYEAHHVVRP